MLGFALLSAASAFVTLKVLSPGISAEAPDLTGKSLNEAREMLMGTGYDIRVESESYDPSIPDGGIIRQDVPPGTRSKNPNINVVLSRGAGVRVVPAVQGKTLDDARKMFGMRAIKDFRIIEVRSENVPSGTVIAQRPTPEQPGGPVTLIVSKGPGEVIYYCPFFRGMRTDDAIVLANELDLNVELIPAGAKGIVTEQRPEPGAEIRAGSTVYLLIGGTDD